VSSNFPSESSNPSPQWFSGAPEPVPAAIPGGLKEWRLPAVLFVATFLSMTFAGIFYSEADVGMFGMALRVLADPSLLLRGLPFSFTFIMILLAHEMGHFFACRHYGIRCTPPFFIPFPISYAGTFGAFIRIKAPFQHKRALFDVGIAGPLAGFIFVIPALIIGIASSQIIPKGNLGDSLAFGEPLLFRWLGRLVIGYDPSVQDMIANPIAMAAWFGLLATSLNLLPIWQLDGGHIAYALFGRERQKRISIGAALALILVSFAGWPIPSYLAFACLILFFGMRFHFYHPPTVWDHEGIGRGREFLGILAFVILFISFTPVPVYIA